MWDAAQLAVERRVAERRLTARPRSSRRLGRPFERFEPARRAVRSRVGRGRSSSSRPRRRRRGQIARRGRSPDLHRAGRTQARAADDASSASLIRWIGKPWRERENPWDRFKDRVPPAPPRTDTHRRRPRRVDAAAARRRLEDPYAQSELGSHWSESSLPVATLPLPGVSTGAENPSPTPSLPFTNPFFFATLSAMV